MPLFQVQDDDRPMFVIASDWKGAIGLWSDQIRKENNMTADEVCEPNGITLICDDDALIVKQAGS